MPAIDKWPDGTCKSLIIPCAVGQQEDWKRPLEGDFAARFWANSSLKLVHTGSQEGTENEAVVNEQNGLSATVFNHTGNSLTTIKVEIWVFEPAPVFITYHNIGQVELSCSDVVANDHKKTIESDAGHTWRPVPTGTWNYPYHVCMAANCYGQDSEGVPDGGAMGLSHFDFLNDPHHAQHNIAIISPSHRSQGTSPGTARGQTAGSLRMQMNVMNPNPRLGELYQVQMHRITGRSAFTAGLRGYLRSRPDVIYASVAPDVRVTGDPYQRFDRDMLVWGTDIEPDRFHMEHEFEHYDKEALREHRLVPTRKRFFLQVEQQSYVPLHFTRRYPQDFKMTSDRASVGRDLTFTLKEHDIKRVSLLVDPHSDDQPGDMHAFDVVQKADDGRVLGGLRLIALMA